MPYAYFDNNASTPMRPEAIDAVSSAMRAGGNASSVHKLGRNARLTVEKARASVAKLVGSPSNTVIFCGSGTEADNQALRCVGAKKVLVSSIEHEAVLQSRPDALKIPVSGDGVLDLEALEKMLAKTDCETLVSVMAANNETGIIQPVKEISRMVRKYNAMFHTDAIQAAGKISVDMFDWDVDFLSLSAHKIGGPQGVGALVARDIKMLNRFIEGGGQESGLRSGTENVPGISGFGVAADLAVENLSEFAKLSEFRDKIERDLIIIEPTVEVFGKGVSRLPNTSKFATPGLTSETQVIGMDLAGFAISAGSACAAGSVEPPYVLTEMGVESTLASCAIRVSLGWATTVSEIDRFIIAWAKLLTRHQHRIGFANV